MYGNNEGFKREEAAAPGPGGRCRAGGSLPPVAGRPASWGSALLQDLI